MKRHILIFGLVGGLLVAALKWGEYRFLVIERSEQIYGGLIAAIFAGVGVWLGIKMNASRRAGKDMHGEALDAVQAQTPIRSQIPQIQAPFVLDEKKREDLGLTRREMEILELVAEGLSNREIAEKLFVSENTVKTHCSRAFEKLGARRRTQAVQLGKQFGLLP